MTMPRRRMMAASAAAGLGLAARAEARSDDPPPSYDGPIIDTHVHVVHTRLPGAPGMELAQQGSIQDYVRALETEMVAARVEKALLMPRWGGRSADDSLGIDDQESAIAANPKFASIGLADPTRNDAAHLERVEAALRDGRIVAFKAYLGYVHVAPNDSGYTPYYRLAAKYNVPVIFHTGDTYSVSAKLKYAHPLGIDDVATDWPGVKFVMAHLGNPWVIDAAEVIYKNNKPGLKENVWADVSALLIGTADQFAGYRRSGVLAEVVAWARKAFYYTERPDRFLFGSDWPLAPLAVYRDLIAEIIPKESHRAVFHDNARTLFRL